MSIIRIEGLEVYAHHGFYEEERKLGNRFKLDLELKVNTTNAEKSDELFDTINYQEVVDRIKTQMKSKSKLLEHVGGRILDDIMNTYPDVQKAKLKISKLSPPIDASIKAVSVEILRKRKSKL